MRNNLVSISSYAKGPNKKTVLKLLTNAANISGSELEIITEDKTIFDYTAYFSVKGTEVQLISFSELINRVAENHNENLETKAIDRINSKKYKVDSVQISHSSPHSLHFDITTSRFHSIKELARQVRGAIHIDLDMKQTNHFLKKQIVLTAKGDVGKLEKFKAIFLQYLDSKKPIIEIEETLEPINQLDGLKPSKIIKMY